MNLSEIYQKYKKEVFRKLNENPWSRKPRNLKESFVSKTYRTKTSDISRNAEEPFDISID